jgi:orotate phosphoribosyltransferase-like protein
MANKNIRDELKTRGVRHWELAHELGVSEQTLVRWLRFELDEERQLDMLMKIEEIAKRKERSLETEREE